MYQVEQGRWHESWPLPGHLAVLAAPAASAVLHRVVVGLADGVLLEAVALYPAMLVRPLELRPDLRREAVEQVEQCTCIPSHHGAGKTEGLAAGVGEDTGGDSLGGASPLELVALVEDAEVEEPIHPVLDVIGQWVALGAGLAGLPEGESESRSLSRARLRRFRSASVRGTPSLSTTCAAQSGQQGTRKGSPVSSSLTSLPLDVAHR